MNKIVFVDTEVGGNRVLDYGAVYSDGKELHTSTESSFKSFITGAKYMCGHNIINHDSKYLKNVLNNEYIFIDTLFLSPLLYPKQNHHNLLKNDKLIPEELNNPLNDAKKCMNLFNYELEAFELLPKKLKDILGSLLYRYKGFSGFFDYVTYDRLDSLDQAILSFFEGKICSHCRVSRLIDNFPVELAYCLALINCETNKEVLPTWVQVNFPRCDYVMHVLRGTPCEEGCPYCDTKFNLKAYLKKVFGYDNFRTYDGEPLQENAAKAAVEGKSLLAIFPTGGGKSITFQLPALMAGEYVKGLTVVISPLQSLMKDQVDGLTSKGIVDAVTINGMLNPIERKEAIERVESGQASLLYISPELLRSKTIEHLLMMRNIVRIVIDEAHCFSSWGHDFRVDYLYIADFIKRIQKLKGLDEPIPVSCFTATAKQKVISDICDYFRVKLGLNLELFTTSSSRKNLTYKVEYKENDDDKYNALRGLLKVKNCPTIIYVSRTKTTIDLAKRLCDDGFKALPFNGKLDRSEKIANQEKFLSNEVDIMVATSAFGMGVDKPDVKLVVHYEISDSLENYIQEAGRAGRNQSLQADCIVYYNESDLDKHFMLANQTKLSMDEIRQVWKGIKYLTSKRDSVSCSALELARAAGWDDSIDDIETRVRTAVSALESAGYVSRGLNVPQVFATNIMVRNVEEAKKKLIESQSFTEEEIVNSVRIITSLISSKNTYSQKSAEAESRVDYLADRLGLERILVVDLIERMRSIGILNDSEDMNAIIKKTEHAKIINDITHFAGIERYLIDYLEKLQEHYGYGDAFAFDLKQLSDTAQKENVKKITIKKIKLVLFYWTIAGYTHKTLHVNDGSFEIKLKLSLDDIRKKIDSRYDIVEFIANELIERADQKNTEIVNFSVGELLDAYNHSLNLFGGNAKMADIKKALLFLSKLGIVSIEGGFLVIYNAMRIKKLKENNKNYKIEDYKTLKEYYELKIQQIHIVGKYANMMVEDYNQALEFVNDYFQMQYEGFIKKYFKGDEKGRIKRNISASRYNKLFGGLSEKQKEIIDDSESKYITVLAGPGSGKTKLLVHKLASLLLEEIKSEQLLMLTFSRSAAMEFKSRLIDLIGEAAYYVDIKTFHSYCFDLLGKIGNKDEFEDVVVQATEMINNGEVEQEKITKTVLVIDEAQDIDEKSYNLICALLDKNIDMKVIAVGDDDQNIFTFRKSDSKYMKLLSEGKEDSKTYELIQNFRSVKKLIDFTNAFVRTIKNRYKRTPIEYVRKDRGTCEIVRCSTDNLESPIVNAVIEKLSNDAIYKNKKHQIAVLTRTNDEALKVYSLLKEKDINATLIQQDDKIKLMNLMEINFFVRLIDKVKAPIISLDRWNEDINILRNRFPHSAILEDVIKFINRYASVSKYMYKSDFVNYINESNIEDIYDYSNAKVVVSTIHKSKGHEFDAVYILLNNINLVGSYGKSEGEIKRELYVGITRAKTELFLYTNNDALRYYYFNYCDVKHDDKEYEEPTRLIMPLTLRDVDLSRFKSLQKRNLVLTNCYPGQELLDIGKSIGVGNDKIFDYSRFRKEELNKLIMKGYEIYHKEIRYIVFWRNKDDLEDQNEYAIILPTLYLRKTDREITEKDLFYIKDNK